jgi:proline iminopeptidase
MISGYNARFRNAFHDRTMPQLYPALEPDKVWTLETGTAHHVYVEECGNPAGLPVILLHGGPGSGSKPYHRQFFDPARYRIVIFDQRGCGRSTPVGETCNNTTADLIADMEAIRRRLGVEQWILFGGSWGATLALLYAQQHPQRVRAMILRGAFLARRRDVDWFFADGVSRIFPERWSEFVRAFPEARDGNFVDAAWRNMHDGVAAHRRATALAWSAWTGRVVTWLLPASDVSASSPSAEQLARMENETMIETHYAHHRYFIAEDQILQQIDRIPTLPCIIVHGRRDLTCPVESSWSLHRAIPQSQLRVLPDAGHLANEPAMIDALITASNQIAEMLA